MSLRKFSSCSSLLAVLSEVDVGLVKYFMWIHFYNLVFLFFFLGSIKINSIMAEVVPGNVVTNILTWLGEEVSDDLI